VVFDPVFSHSHLDSQTIPITLDGYRTNRLSLEQEMIYIATHWALERKCYAGGVVPFVDMTYLIHKYGHEINWDRLLVALKDSKSSVYLYLMLRYLERQEIIHLPSMVMERLVSKLEYPLGPSEAVLYVLINSYSMSGRPYGKVMSKANLGIIWETLLESSPPWKNLLMVPWNIVFPSRLPHRFNLVFQFSRLSRLLGIQR
jgi:hypothetical protein